MQQILNDGIRPIQWSEDHLRLLDQRLLPEREVWLELRNAGEVAEAIRDMAVRGAPAIGITAAYGMVLAAKSHPDDRAALQKAQERLASSRPTAVNLAWALQRIWHLIEWSPAHLSATLLTEALAIHAEDVAANHQMGRLGAALIKGGGVLTHCNTGSLATGGFGTALGVIRQAWWEERLSAVYVDETRPWLQGARLTAWELVRDAIPVTLICEGAAASLLSSGRIGWVVVGADRIAANGDVANKIGTYSLAVLARHHGVQFMIVAPSSTLDIETSQGQDIIIEQRPEDEVLTCSARRIAPIGTRAWNPVFDVTPAELIDVIVTERGVLLEPARTGIAPLLGVSAGNR